MDLSKDTEMLEIVKRVIIAVLKRKLVKKFKKRSPIDRMKARLYYKRHRTKIKYLRKRQKAPNKLLHKTKKLFKRTRPAWLTHKKKITHPKLKKPVFKKPKIKRLKFHVPKRKSE